MATVGGKRFVGSPTWQLLTHTLARLDYRSILVLQQYSAALLVNAYLSKEKAKFGSVAVRLVPLDDAKDDN